MRGRFFPSSKRAWRPRRGPRIPRAAALLAAAAIGLAAGAAPSWLGRSHGGDAGKVHACRVTDGDTIRCGRERIRLIGIDAPELPGHCRPGRHCAPGDGHASTASLRAAMAPEMTIARVGEDRYGRTLATVTGPQGDLSCWQLRHRQAIYRYEWDNGLRVAAACPLDTW